MVHNSDCSVCKKEVTIKCKGLACDVCDDWFHSSCVGVSTPIYKGLNNSKVGLMWYCPSCHIKVMDLINNLKQSQTNPGDTDKKRPTSTVKIDPSPTDKAPVTKTKFKIVDEKSIIVDEKASNGNKIVDEKASNGNKHVKKRQAAKLENENRFRILGNMGEDVECQFTLVGDSLVRAQEDIFCSRGAKPRRRFCVPGGRVKNIKEVTSNLGHSRGHVIVNVGINDVILKPKVKGMIPKPNRNSESIYEDYKELVTSLSKRKRKSLLVGILPRKNVSSEIYGRIVCMNTRVKSLCEKLGVCYMDMWDVFNNGDHLYNEDGLHLNYQGSKTYSKLLEKGLNNLGF